VRPSETSGRLLFNVPLALLMVAGLRWLALNVDVRYRGSEGPRKDWRRRKQHHSGSNSQQGSGSEGAAPHKEGRWREKVRAPVVEHAWEMLCGSIIQQARPSCSDDPQSSQPSPPGRPVSMQLALGQARELLASHVQGLASWLCDAPKHTRWHVHTCCEFGRSSGLASCMHTCPESYNSA